MWNKNVSREQTVALSLLLITTIVNLSLASVVSAQWAALCKTQRPFSERPSING